MANWNTLAYKDYTKNPWNYTLDFKFGKGPNITEQYMNSKNWLGLSKKNNPFSRGNINGPKGMAAMSAITLGIHLGDTLLNKGITNKTGNVLNTISSGLGAIPTPYTQAASMLFAGAGLIANGFTDRVNTAYLKAKNLEISNVGNWTSAANDYEGLVEDMAQFKGVELGDLDLWGDIGFLSSGSNVKEARRKAQGALTAALGMRLGNVNARGQGINMMNTLSQLGHLTAFGGELDTVNPSTAIGYSLYADKYVKDMAKNNGQGTTNMFNGVPQRIFAFGGNLQTKGGIWSDGLTHIETGGTHEENPNDGVQVGTDRNGIPNLVEEDEVIYDDYVFSDRLIVPRGKRGNYGKRNKYAKGGKLDKSGKEDMTYDEQVLKPFVGLTFAEAAKKAERQSGVTDRPNDPIAKRGLEATLSILANQQEKEREKEKLEEMQEAIDNMTPEELAMLQAQMQQGQQPTEEEMMAQQQMIPQGMEQLQQQPGEQQPIAALGGLLNSENEFKYGGNLEKFTNELRSYGLTLDDYLAYYRSANNIAEDKNVTLTDANFNRDTAEQYLKQVTKAQKEVARKYKQEGLNPSDLTGASLEAYQRDVTAAARGTNVSDGDLAINGFSSNNRGDARATDFNRYAYTRTTRQNLIGGGATAIAPNKEGKFDINYGIENPTGLTYVEGMPKWNASSQQWEDSEGKKIDNPFGEGTKFSDVKGGGYNSQFENQDALSNYYKEQIAKRFQNLKGDKYQDSRLPNYYLSKEELGNWIKDLEGSDDAKDKELATMLRANWNLDADNLVESDAYLGLPATQNNRLQRDAKPGIEHIPYLDAVPYSGIRYREVGIDGNPTDNYVNWDPANPTAGFSVIEEPLSTEGGVTTYGIRRNDLATNVGVLPDGTYVSMTPEQAALYANNKVADPSALPQFTAPLAGYNHNATYYDLSNDAAGNPLGQVVTTEDDAFPKAPVWPYVAGIGLQGASALYNILTPADYSNADAMISAAKTAGTYTPISARFAGQQLPYKPAPDMLFGKLAGQTLKGARDIINNSRGNAGATVAGLLGNTYLGNIAYGNAHQNWRQGNWGMFKDVQTFGLTRDAGNYDRDLKAQMSNQDAETRARGYQLEGMKSGYAMRQAIDDAKANAISAGISGIGTMLYNMADTNYKNKVLGWGIRHGAYAPQKVAKGGKLRTRRRKGLSF